MRWSKLKKRIEERFAEELSGRLVVNVTRYRKSHDQMQELWLSVDGERVAGWSEGVAYSVANKRRQMLEQQGAGFFAPEAWEWAREKQCFPEDQIMAMFESLSLSVEDMLAHRNALLRALALADARLGKRRLNVMKREDLTTALERKVLELRVQPVAVLNPNSAGSIAAVGSSFGR